MAPLLSLPTELLIGIISQIHARSTLAALRLTNQLLNSISTPFYFATIPFYPEWRNDEDHKLPDPPFPNQIEYDTVYFQNILNDEKLKKLVKKVEIYFCNPDCDHHPHWANCGGRNMYRGYMPRPEMSDTWTSCFNRLPELTRLESISLIFDRHAGEEDGDFANDDILQDPHDRISWTMEAFDVLVDLIEIRELSIRHMQHYSRDSYYGDPKWAIPDGENTVILRKVLRGLRALRLNMVHEQPRGETGTVYKVTDIHIHWSSFPSKWLTPAPNLLHLTLYSDVPLGFFPKLDLGPVHFPNLRTLALGHFIFSHDHQFSFITSHGSTLRELYLDHCAILYQHGAYQETSWLGQEGFPLLDPRHYYSTGYSSLREPEDGRVLELVPYSRRWHSIFTSFKTELPQLHTFRFGSSSKWKFDLPNRRDDGSPGMPIMPWEAEGDLVNEIFKGMYVVYDDWNEEYNCEWGYGDKEVLIEEVWGEDIQRFEEYPACSVEDKEALSSLLRKLGVDDRVVSGDEPEAES